LGEEYAKYVPIFRLDAPSKFDENVVRQQFPLTLAWAITHWKSQGMTLKRVRVRIGTNVAGQVGVAFVAVTRVGHPWSLMFETDLPEYDAFEAAKWREEFRSRERFELHLRAKASRTLRKYRFCEEDVWTEREAMLANELLLHVESAASLQRRREGLDGDVDAWPWPDVDEPPVVVECAAAAERLVRDGVCELEEVLAVVDRLRGPLHLPAVLEALGCLIPRALHRRLDGVKPRGNARAGAAVVSAALVVGGWKVNVDDERAVGEAGRALSKGSLEFFLRCLHRAADVARARVAVGTHAFGQRLVTARSGVELSVHVGTMQSWTEEGGLREACAQAELVLVPVNVDRGKLVRDCALLCVTSDVAGQRIGEASALRMQVFDRLQRDDRAKELARKLEVVLPGAAGARGSRSVAVEMLEGFAECADAADVGVFVLGAIAQRVAKASSLQCAGDLTGAESVRSLRSRLRAAFQFLRREVDRLGVRDILHTMRGGGGEEVRRCRSLVELLAAPSSGQERLGADLAAQSARSSRSLPMLRGDEVQPLAFVTWNVAGNDVACTAPEGFCAQDKFARVAEALQRWQPDVLAVQESPAEGALVGVERSFRLVGSVAAHAGYVQLYVRPEAEVTVLPIVPGVPAVFARMKVGACFLTIVVVHLAPHLEGATARREQLAVIVEALRAVTSVRDDEGAGVAPSARDGVVLLGDFNVRRDEVVELLEAGDWREAGYQGNSWDPQKNCFFEAARRHGVSGHAFDRVWFRGGLWLQAFFGWPVPALR
jgi:exonuclease III